MLNKKIIADSNAKLYKLNFEFKSTNMLIEMVLFTNLQN